MCTYSISISDSLLENVRSAFPNEESMEQWIQKQMDIILLDFVSKQRKNTSTELTLAQRLRGIASAPKDFDYKQELANRYEA